MSLRSEKLIKLIHEKRLYLDGGMGTVLLSKLPPDISLEDATLLAPETVKSVHRAYLDAGSSFITSNTFSVNCDKNEDYELRIKAAMDIAKQAVSEFEDGTKKDVFIAFDIGPTGRLMKPMGDLSFDDAVRIFGENIRLGEKYGADLLLIETMTDLTELRAAVTAARDISKLPVFATCAFSENGRLLTGASVKEVVCELEKAGVCALGTNCSFGPDKMLSVADEFVKYSSLPVIVSPNAGLPEIVNGNAVYSIDPNTFARQMYSIAKTGVQILGGCCGTTPDHIRELVKATRDLPYSYPDKKNSENEEDDGRLEDDEGLTQTLENETPLMRAIFDGEDMEAVGIAESLLLEKDALEIINEEVIPALNKVGNDFATGELFLPELMMCAETATAVFSRLKEDMIKSDETDAKSIIIATVKGDIHDIGKDIAKVLLESYGFKVYDLGIDVPVGKIIEKINETGCKLVGLSVLMTTTVPSLTSTVKEIREKVCDAVIIAGGTVLTDALCKGMGANFYAPDAMATVNYALNYYDI